MKLSVGRICTSFAFAHSAFCSISMTPREMRLRARGGKLAAIKPVSEKLKSGLTQMTRGILEDGMRFRQRIDKEIKASQTNIKATQKEIRDLQREAEAQEREDDMQYDDHFALIQENLEADVEQGNRNHQRAVNNIIRRVGFQVKDIVEVKHNDGTYEDGEIIAIVVTEPRPIENGRHHSDPGHKSTRDIPEARRSLSPSAAVSFTVDRFTTDQDPKIKSRPVVYIVKTKDGAKILNRSQFAKLANATDYELEDVADRMHQAVEDAYDRDDLGAEANPVIAQQVEQLVYAVDEHAFRVARELEPEGIGSEMCGRVPLEAKLGAAVKQEIERDHRANLYEMRMQHDEDARQDHIDRDQARVNRRAFADGELNIVAKGLEADRKLFQAMRSAGEGGRRRIVNGSVRYGR